MNSKGDPDTMAIRIITDSASDITQVEAAAWGVQVLPLRTIFGQEEFLDGITIDHETFFQKLIESDVLPTTSQLSPFQYEEPFRQAAEAGDEVVCITLSYKLSGCYQSASIAAEDLPVVLVDSLNVTVGERLLVERAVQLRDQGLSAQEIGQQLETEKSQIRLIALLDTLEYLKKGGRISSAAALAGSLLSIKPVIAVEDGEIAILGKARGSKNGNNMLMTLVEKNGGINFEMPYCLAYSGLSDALLRKYIADSQSLYSGRAEHLPVSTIGSTIGTHAGPGAIAVAFFSNC